jgi:hypothetical protein
MSNNYKRDIIKILHLIDAKIPKNHDVYKIWQYELNKLLSSICYIAPENESYKWLKLSLICNQCFKQYKTEKWVLEIEKIISM